MKTLAAAQLLGAISRSVEFANKHFPDSPSERAKCFVGYLSGSVDNAATSAQLFKLLSMNERDPAASTEGFSNLSTSAPIDAPAGSGGN